MKFIKFTITLIIFFGISSINQSCKSPKLTQTNDNSTLEKVEIAEPTDIEALYKSLNNGGNIKLKKLIYNLERPLVISNKSNLTLDGNGSTFIMNNKSEDVLTVRSSDNVTLKNFKATHIDPDGPIGCTGSVIQVDNNTNVLIEKCQLNGSGIIGVVSYNTQNLKVIDNYIYNNSEYGVLFDENTTIEIKDNKFEDNGKNGNDHVAQALNIYLSEVKKIEKGMNLEGLKMSNNIFN